MSESYLFRLTYKFRDMRDVSGEAYKRLKEEYERLCEKNEAAAARYEAERQHLRATRNAADQKHGQKGDRMGPSGA